MPVPPHTDTGRGLQALRTIKVIQDPEEPLVVPVVEPKLMSTRFYQDDCSAKENHKNFDDHLT